MKSGLASAAIAVAVLGLGGTTAMGQTLELGGELETYTRLLEISGLVSPGSYTIRPMTVDGSRLASSGHPWASRLRAPAGGLRWSGHARARIFANTDRPFVANDGAVWQGKGVTTALDASARLDWRALSMTLNPLLTFNQNSAFELAPTSRSGLPPWGYPWWRIDQPQRFGLDPFWALDAGDSELAASWGWARLSFGNGSMWWGPAVRNAIVMTNNAGGFPHAALTTVRPIDVGIGTLEGQWIWGGLSQSDWFDPAMTPTRRFYTGIVLSYRPSFLPGLALGGTRVFQELVSGDWVPFGDHFLVWQGLLKARFASNDNPEGEDARDQLLSLFARWSFPESGFETYVEWARNDHSWNLTDFILEPEHSQAYTLGFQKVIGVTESRMLSLSGELTHLEAPPTFQLRSRGIYYAHHIIQQGYTHRGQIIGSGLGPGGNAQFLGVDLYERWGRAGLSMERRVHDNDAFWVVAQENDLSFDLHHVSLNFGADIAYFLRDFELGGGLVLTREFNRYFQPDEHWNLNFSTSARWRGW